MYYLFINTTNTDDNWKQIYISETIEECEDFLRKWMIDKYSILSKKFRIMKLEAYGDIEYNSKMSLIKYYEVKENEKDL